MAGLYRHPCCSGAGGAGVLFITANGRGPGIDVIGML
jgi:hypothetical protein